jgi:hypothetical protein
VELGDPQQGHRQPRRQQHLLGGVLGVVVAVGDAVDADDRDVHQVPQPVAVHRLHQPPRPGDVDLPVGAVADARGRVHDDLRTRQRRRQVAAGRQVAAHPAGTGPPPRHLPHSVAAVLQALDDQPTERPRPSRHENVHTWSLAGPFRRGVADPPHLTCEIS